ncbi:MAG: FHA domain-containing protein [Myxococcales bacterium]|nr:FHA domain-containing protein [Myxococcales bacterium]
MLPPPSSRCLHFTPHPRPGISRHALGAPVKVVIDIVGGARAGRRIEFDDPATLRIGRHPDCEVAFDPQADLDASSRHAEVRREGAAFWLHDLASANGTRVDGGPSVKKRVLLADGALVEFGSGGPRCRFSFGAAAGRRDAPALGAVLSTRHSGRVGQATVAAMISDALAEARARHSGGAIGRSGTFVRSLVHASMTRSTRTFKLASLALSLTLAGAVVALAVIVRRVARPEESIRQDLLHVMEEQRTADGIAVKSQLGELTDELSRARASQGGRAIASAAREGVYLVAVRAAAGSDEGFCTAFAIAPHHLATNAHCVVLASDLRRRGGTIEVVRNGDGRVRFTVVRMKRSGAYVPGGATITPDVGILQVDETLQKPLVLASREALAQLQPGDAIYTYGFPGRLADTLAPEATFVQGVVGRITRLDGEAGAFADSVLIQHSAFTAGGTSGSPIFDGAGRIVAVNAGGYVEDGELKTKDLRSGKPGALVVAQPLHGYNFGMRIDLVESLSKEADQ